MKAVIVSHWDVDGVAAAAIARRRGAITVKLSALAALPKMLEEAVHAAEANDADTLIVADLNPSPGQETLVEASLDYAVALDLRIVWLDHHEWPKELVEKIHSLGVELILDSERVSAELVMDFVGCNDSVCMRLASMARDDDLFLNRDHMAVRWRRILRWYGWRVRYNAVRDWARGIIWPEWVKPLWEKLSTEYDKLMNETIRRVLVVRCDGVKLAIVKVASEKLHPGEVHAKMLESGIEADIYAMIYENGVSLRSTSIPLACIARTLGGGGHENAAGIPGDSWTPDKLANALLHAMRACATREHLNDERARRLG